MLNKSPEVFGNRNFLGKKILDKSIHISSDEKSPLKGWNLINLLKKL